MNIHSLNDFANNDNNRGGNNNNNQNNQFFLAMNPENSEGNSFF